MRDWLALGIHASIMIRVISRSRRARHTLPLRYIKVGPVIGAYPNIIGVQALARCGLEVLARWAFLAFLLYAVVVRVGSRADPVDRIDIDWVSVVGKGLRNT
jgi:hypothetical protein